MCTLQKGRAKVLTLRVPSKGQSPAALLLVLALGVPRRRPLVDHPALVPFLTDKKIFFAHVTFTSEAVGARQLRLPLLVRQGHIDICGQNLAALSCRSLWRALGPTHFFTRLELADSDQAHVPTTFGKDDYRIWVTRMICESDGRADRHADGSNAGK